MRWKTSARRRGCLRSLITAADVLENNNIWLNGVKRSYSCPVIGGFRSTLSGFFFYLFILFHFCGQSFVAVIMIEISKTRKSLLKAEVPSPYVIERRSEAGTRKLILKPSC